MRLGMEPWVRGWGLRPENEAGAGGLGMRLGLEASEGWRPGNEAGAGGLGTRLGLEAWAGAGGLGMRLGLESWDEAGAGGLRTRLGLEVWELSGLEASEGWRPGNEAGAADMVYFCV